MDLAEVDRILTRMDVIVSYKNARRFVNIQILFFTAVFLWRVVMQLYSSSQVLVIMYSILNVFGYINTITMCQYFNFVFLMRQRYVWIGRKLVSLRKIINNKEIDPAFLMYPNDFVPVKRTVSKIQMKGQNIDSLVELQLLNKMHNTLHNVSVKITRAYNLQLLFIIAIRFITILTQLLNAYKIMNGKTDSKKTLVNNILTGVYFFLHVLKIFAVCSISASTAEKSKENSEEILKIFSHNKDLKRNVNNFATRMLLQNTQFDCCGFFKLDYVLIYNIVGATTTYLIILIQFDINATQ
ncbi:Gustatory receptor 2a [Carabus blaptoides fortunei]